MKTKFNGILTLLLALVVQFTFAQEKTVSGTVSDETGPLPGVNVIVKGTSNGTQTDFDGKFSVTASANDIIVFSFIGMNTIEKTVGASNTINVVMEGNNVLEEVVILGYGTQKKTEITGSTVQVNADEIANVPVASVDQVLQGKVAGLVINGSSGTPGATNDIRIRGISSITAGNEPLFVIDGVPMVNGNASATTSGSSLSILSSIDSNNIESMTVLKDASATAAYGARGANGVVVITTKSGRAGKTSFNFNSSYGWSNDAVDGPTPLTAAEREMLYYEAIYNTYGEAYGFTKDEAQDFYETYPSSFGTDYTDWNAAGRPEGNWSDVITNENAPLQEYNLSAQGGDETSSFYVSLGYYDQEATVIGSTFDRISGSLNFDKQLSESIKFSTKNQASHTYQDGLLESSAYFSSPRAVKFFMPGLDQPYTTEGEINVLDPGTSLPNPLWIAQEDIDDSKFTRILSNNSVEWATPIENLVFSSRVNIDYQIYNYKRYRNRVRGDGASTDGYGWQEHNSRTNYVFQNALDYSFDINEDHSISVKALQEWQKNRFYYLGADGESFADDGLTNLDSAGSPTSAYSGYTDWSIASYLGTIHYSGYNSKYVLDATFRREGSSRFAPDNRWGNFWSVGAAWNIFKEGFMENADWLSNLKLRASYGVTGNASIDLNQFQAKFGYGSDYAGEGAVVPTTFGNDDLSWETSYTYDIGLEFGFLQNRISGSIAYYNRESRDLLLDVPLSLTTGFTSQYRNIGSMENKGIEGEINFRIIEKEDFNLSLGGNFASNANEVLKLAKDGNGETITITSSTRKVDEGHPVYGWFMPTWAGVDPETGSELWYINGEEGTETTDNFNDAEAVWQGGSQLPTITAGMNFHVDFKGIFLDASAYYAGGHKVYESWARYTQGTDLFTTAYYQGLNTLLDRWQEPGDTGTRNGKFEYTTRPWQSHSKFLYDGDFIRLKNVTLGYDFNSKTLEQINFFDSFRVYVRATNAFTWVKDEYLKFDPETISSNGQTALTTPASKSFIFGINFKF
ncbi:SusC/RagA family TonB-linked outer membrane protein [Lutibacter holmesii]|uniref:SusC/RagA family TonB-linked outer membrane protein n=1 Tax=Lutibacter holmesii TaxID=1137985 RepID=A0ABW3WNR6_9FLAO